jgi:digeranylgeranylglycerophospholipid reductase
MERRAIVVVGAGPAGSAAAHAAARAGVPPLLVEADESPGAGNACGGLAALAIRDRLGLPADVVEREIRRTVLHVDGLAFEFAGRRPRYMSFERARFDAFLAERAVQAGAELLTATRVVAVDAAKRRVTLLDGTSRRGREVAADVLVFADGPRTLASGAFGIGYRPGADTKRAVYWDLEGDVESPDTVEVHVDTTLPTTGYVWVFPRRGRVQVGVGAPYGSGGSPLRERLARFVEARADLRGRPILRRHGGIIPGRPARELVADGAVVVGDAAGLVNPLTGGGIVMALRSGDIAGRVAAEAVRAGRTDRRGLSAYARRFRATPHYLWLRLMTRLWARLDRCPPEDRVAAYARTLRRYFAFLHRVGWVVDLLLRRG